MNGFYFYSDPSLSCAPRCELVAKVKVGKVPVETGRELWKGEGDGWVVTGKQK